MWHHVFSWSTVTKQNTESCNKQVTELRWEQIRTEILEFSLCHFLLPETAVALVD